MDRCEPDAGVKGRLDDGVRIGECEKEVGSSCLRVSGSKVSGTLRT
jgi:hypothetical protein